MLCVGQPFPSWTCKACVGNDHSDLTTISSADRAISSTDRWSLFLFYPKDFTFVCPTELVEFGNQIEDFNKRGVDLFGASTDNEFSHLAWRNSHPMLKELPYPLLSTQKLATELGITHDVEGVCYRASFLVDPQGIIQWVNVNPLPVGRSVDEALRVIDAIQSKEMTPCNWSPGKEFVKA
jgi:alkyl hydroperoxide reductase subunit AhpC